MSPAGAAGVLVGLALAVAGVAKRASPTWPQQARALAAPPVLVPVLPWVEIGLGALLVAGVGRPWAAWAAVALLVGFTAALVRSLAQGRRPPCACFGVLSARPIGPWTVLRNLVLIAVAVVAAVAT